MAADYPGVVGNVIVQIGFAPVVHGAPGTEGDVGRIAVAFLQLADVVGRPGVRGLRRDDVAAEVVACVVAVGADPDKVENAYFFVTQRLMTVVERNLLACGVDRHQGFVSVCNHLARCRPRFRIGTGIGVGFRAGEQGEQEERDGFFYHFVCCFSGYWGNCTSNVMNSPRWSLGHTPPTGSISSSALSTNWSSTTALLEIIDEGPMIWAFLGANLASGR